MEKKQASEQQNIKRKPSELENWINNAYWDEKLFTELVLPFVKPNILELEPLDRVRPEIKNRKKPTIQEKVTLAPSIKDQVQVVLVESDLPRLNYVQSNFPVLKNIIAENKLKRLCSELKYAIINSNVEAVRAILNNPAFDMALAFKHRYLTNLEIAALSIKHINLMDTQKSLYIISNLLEKNVDYSGVITDILDINTAYWNYTASQRLFVKEADSMQAKHWSLKASLTVLCSLNVTGRGNCHPNHKDFCKTVVLQQKFYRALDTSRFVEDSSQFTATLDRIFYYYKIYGKDFEQKELEFIAETLLDEVISIIRKGADHNMVEQWFSHYFGIMLVNQVISLIDDNDKWLNFVTDQIDTRLGGENVLGPLVLLDEANQQNLTAEETTVITTRCLQQLRNSEIQFKARKKKLMLFGYDLAKLEQKEREEATLGKEAMERATATFANNSSSHPSFS